MNTDRSMAIVWVAFFLALTIMAVMGIAAVVSIESIDNPVNDPVYINEDTVSGTVTAYENEYGQFIVLNRIVDWENRIVCHVHIVDDVPADPVCSNFETR